MKVLVRMFLQNSQIQAGYFVTTDVRNKFDRLWVFWLRDGKPGLVWIHPNGEAQWFTRPDDGPTYDRVDAVLIEALVNPGDVAPPERKNVQLERHALTGLSPEAYAFTDVPGHGDAVAIVTSNNGTLTVRLVSNDQEQTFRGSHTFNAEAMQ